MTTKLPDRLWRDIGISGRAVRVAWYVGVAAFLAFWVLTGWLDGAAFRQSNVATGIYQFPYNHKGQTNYITAGQAALDSWRIFLAMPQPAALQLDAWALCPRGGRSGDFLAKHDSSARMPDSYIDEIERYYSS